MSEGFRASKEIVFDVRTDVHRDFEAWATKWPLDACAYRSCGLARETSIKWTSDTSIRGLGPEAYKDRLVQIVFSGK